MWVKERNKGRKMSIVCSEEKDRGRKKGGRKEGNKERLCGSERK